MGKKEWDSLTITLDADEATIMLSYLNAYQRMVPSVESKKNAAAFSSRIRKKIRDGLAKSAV